MIQWLHNKYDTYEGDKNERAELDNLRRQVQILDNQLNQKGTLISGGHICQDEELKIEEIRKKQLEENKDN